jgi:nucleoside-diphosphate-sugar epimerase
MVMRVFVAGGTGAIGRRLVPQLVARGHQVTATTTTAAKLGLAERLGAEAVVMDGLDAPSVGEAVAAARPDAIVHQMTALSVANAGKPDFKHPERFGAVTNRLRTEGTDHLLAAAEATGVSHVVAQSFALWTAHRARGLVTEEEPLQLQELPAKMRIIAEPLHTTITGRIPASTTSRSPAVTAEDLREWDSSQWAPWDSNPEPAD